MSTQQRVKRIRGTTADNAAATLPEAVLVVKSDPIDGTVWVHDGVTAGGFPIGTGAVSFPLDTSLGGTGQSSLTAHAVILGGMSPVGFATIGTAGRVLADQGAGADPIFETLTALLDAMFGSARGDVLYRGASAWLALAPGTVGRPLVTGGAGADPSYATLGVAGGGTGDATLTAHAVLLGEGTSAIAFASIGTANRVLADNGAGADPTFQSITALLDAAFGSARGDILYRGAGAWLALVPGTSGYLLQTQGAGADPAWVASAAAIAPTRTTGISAAGTNQATATQLTTDWNIVSAVSAGQGVALRSGSTTGLPQWVFNADAADDLLVYTKNGDSASIGTLGTTAGFTIPANSGAEFRPVSLTQWYPTI